MAEAQNKAVTSDVRLIEAGFPCHQVGAETQRERGASSALPPLYFLHVWWARRPLTPSRAAVLASLQPAGTDPDQFVRALGIEKKVVRFGEREWVLVGPLLEHVSGDRGSESLAVDASLLRAFGRENERRAENRATIARLKDASQELARHSVLVRWERESVLLVPRAPLVEGQAVRVERVAAEPAHVAERIEFAKRADVIAVLGKPIKWDAEDLYGYGRAFANDFVPPRSNLVVLDPTAGGGSIPFEALRLGHTVIANELNPVATTILHATLEYPAKFGAALKEDIATWGTKLVRATESEMAPYFAFSDIPEDQLGSLKAHLRKHPRLVAEYAREHDYMGLLFVRQVTCPHCHGEAPLLNTFWLSKEAADPWGVRVVTDGKKRGGKVSFETYQVTNGKGPNREDPNGFTVDDGVGACVHCHQAIDGDEIKRQARGESPFGKWQDRLYAVVAIRLQPKLNAKGEVQRFKDGARAGQIKTEQIRYFRPSNARDLSALEMAGHRLAEKWSEWDALGQIPAEAIPEQSNYNRGHRLYGVTRWCDMFTPRQLLAHLSMTRNLELLLPTIAKALGKDRARAVVTYLQFVIDKGLDYNSRQTVWITQRASIGHTFSRHDFSLKWTFAEMVFTGPKSGAAWALAQVLDAYAGIAALMAPLNKTANGAPPLTILNGSAAHMPQVPEGSVDLVCMDPPYYDNVQYAELSDFFYVWQRRTLRTLYPQLYSRRATNKADEAVANPARDGSAAAAKSEYQRLMQGTFAECRRVLKNDGVMTLMFTHTKQEAWEMLTKALIESGWSIASAFPVESEFANSSHQLDKASAGSSVFLACRKRAHEGRSPSPWVGLGGSGVANRVAESVRKALHDFEPLGLAPVDRMIASYGRALQVLSEAWPVLDGDTPVGPLRAMAEAARVVTEQEVSRITQGRLKVDELDSETALALTAFGIYGHNEFAYDDGLNLSRSLNIEMASKPAGYHVEGRRIGVNQAVSGRRAAGASAEDKGFYAPLVRKGSKLRLALSGERAAKRLETPQTAWDLLHGTLAAYRQGDIPVARAYLQKHGKGKEQVLVDLLRVFAIEAADPDLKRDAQNLLFGMKAGEAVAA